MINPTNLENSNSRHDILGKKKLDAPFSLIGSTSTAGFIMIKIAMLLFVMFASMPSRKTGSCQTKLRTHSKSEYDSNFFQLLKLRCEDDPKLAEWMDKKTNKFLSPKIQNEMLQIMALQILRDIAKT